MTNDEAKNKIKKLLRLGRSANKHEADLALRRALELAQRFCMSLEELDLEKDLEAIAERAFRVGMRLSLEHKLAANTVLNFFGCEVVLGRPDILFVGTAAGIEIGEYVFVFLVREARKAKRDFMARNYRMGHRGRASFLNGFFWAINANLRKGRQEFLESKPGFEIVLSEQLSRFRDYCTQKYSLVNSRKESLESNPSAVNDGWLAGKKVEINQPLAGSTAPAMLEMQS